MTDPKLIRRILTIAEHHPSDVPNDMVVPTDVEGLLLLRTSRTTALESTLYQPLLCLVLQGRKDTYLGTRKVSFGPGESIIVSHTLPVVSQITEASARAPYVALVFEIDLDLLRSVHDELDAVPSESRSAMHAGRTQADLIDALGRLVALHGRPLESRVVGPLVRREIHFHLLMAEHGGTLRQMLRPGSPADRVAKAIARIRRSYRHSLPVAELAKEAGMSASTFHAHFKALTETTPLRFQKDLRLLEARRLLGSGKHTVGSAAFEVGYESPTQFSREYSRKFGASPRHDLAGTG